MSISDDFAWYWFTNIESIGRRTRNKLLEIFDTPENILKSDNKTIDSISFLTDRQKSMIIKSDMEKTKRDYDKLQNLGVRFISCENSEYPVSLQNIPDKPHALYIKGHIPNEDNLSVSIIGSRNASEYGKNIAAMIGGEFAKNGVNVISGLAKGIDSAAQRGSVSFGGTTCAVLGCGPDICYPKSNIELYMMIQKNGCIMSEYPPGTAPLAGYFPERNRIISGLGDIILVVEAGEKSGSLITVDCALEQGKEVYAVPGRVTDKGSLGCNMLIKNGANVFVSVEDILEMQGIFSNRKYSVNKKINIVLATEEKMVYAKLGLEPKHVNRIVHETGLPVQTVMRIVLNLEMRHVIRQSANNYYVIDVYNQE